MPGDQAATVESVNDFKLIQTLNFFVSSTLHYIYHLAYCFLANKPWLITAEKKSPTQVAAK